MVVGNSRLSIAAPALRLLAVLAMVATTWMGAAIPATAQATSNIAIVTTENGSSVYDACYELVGYSDVGCDDNGDGKITFWDIPLGTYTVRQVADLGPGRYVNDFTIRVGGYPDSSGFERFFVTVISSSGSSQSSSSGRTSNIAIVTTENGSSVYDACYLLVNFSDVGCDDNGDGKITFWDIPLGSYRVHQVGDLGPSRYVDDFSIQVIGVPDSSGFERFYASVFTSYGSSQSSGSSAPSTAGGTRDIALITRDPDDGHLVLDGCYILLEYGNSACDENGDGQITYKEIPLGTYTVRQTQTPSGYPTIDDFQIVVDSPYPNVPLGYVVRQATRQNSPGSRNVSVVFVDSRTREKIESSICVEFVGGSEAACDDALVDGQIDFIDVPAGTYPMKFTGLPANWQVLTGDMTSSSVTIASSPGMPANQFVYVEVYVPDSAAVGSGSSSGSGNDSPSTAQRTWTASVTVILCDASGQNCIGGAGVKIDISLASGEYMGSCTTGESILTPWGNWISTCSVPGMPFNADFVATQDPSTIPQGYAQAHAYDTVSVQNLDPGGGDQSTFHFLNTRTSSNGTEASETSTSNPNASATLLMTFRGCPEGFNPATADYFANCTIPLDAPDASQILWGGDGMGGMPITMLDRQYNGAYIYNAAPSTMHLILGRLEPVIRDAYTVIGATSSNNNSYIIDLTDGEVREVFVFYYFYP